MKFALISAVFAGALALGAASRPADACGMRYIPEPADEILLAEAAEYEQAEDNFAALRIYDRAMYDHRADIRVRAKAAYRGARLRSKTGDTEGARHNYAFAAKLGAEAAAKMVSGELPAVAEATPQAQAIAPLAFD